MQRLAFTKLLNFVTLDLQVNFACKNLKWGFSEQTLSPLLSLQPLCVVEAQHFHSVFKENVGFWENFICPVFQVLFFFCNAGDGLSNISLQGLISAVSGGSPEPLALMQWVARLLGILVSPLCPVQTLVVSS